MDLNDYKMDGIYFFGVPEAPANRPSGTNGWLKVITGLGGTIKQIWYRLGTPDKNDDQTYVRTYNVTWSGWSQYLTNTYTITPITFESPNYAIQSTGQTRYIVKGGVCYVRLYLRVISPLNTNTAIDGLQLPIPCDTTYNWGLLTDLNGNNTARFYVIGNGGLIIRGGTANTNIFGMLSYPIK